MTAKKARPASWVATSTESSRWRIPAVDQATAASATNTRPRLTCKRRGRDAVAVVIQLIESSGSDRAEQTVLLAARSRSEVERRRRPGGGAVAELETPEPVDRDERAVAVAQLSLVHPLAAAAILIRGDAAVAEVADQQVTAEHAEAGGRCHRKPPRCVRRRVRPSTGLDASDKLPVDRVLVHVPGPTAGDIVVLLRVLLRVGHEDVVRDRLDAERREALRQLRIGERAGCERHRLERLVEHVDMAVVKVGRVEPVSGCREPLVHGPLARAVDCADPTVPFTVGDQPRIVPPSVEKRNRAWPVFPPCDTAKSEATPLKTAPVGAPATATV